MRIIAAALLVTIAAAGAAAQPAPAADELEARYQAGAAAFRAGRPYAALEVLGAVAAASSDYRDVQMLLGQSCLMVGLDRQAKRHFDRVLERQPDNGQAAFLLGFALYRAARWVEAVTALDRAHELARANPYPRLYRGLARLELGDPTAARDDIQAALRLAPDDDAVQAAAAELEFAEGNFAGAVGRLRPVVERTGDPEHRVLLARALVELDQPREAVAVLEAAESRRSDLLYVLGQALLRSGETERGRAVLARFRERKRIEERQRLLEAAVSTDPGDADSLFELVRLLLDDSRPEAAIVHLAALGRLLPGDPRVAELAAELARQRDG
jgi:tetratricopeptide (TPR) repeat protein